MDPIVEKIEKLLALATSSNEHEARLAAAKADELLIRHNLQEQFGADPRLRKYVRETVKNAARVPPEHGHVQSIIRAHFFVEMVTARFRNAGVRQVSVQFVLLGTPTNVTVAKHVYVFLCRAFRRLWAEYRKTRRARPSARKAYWFGLAAGLHAQLTQQRRDTEAAAGAMIVQDTGLAKFVNETFGGGLTEGRKPRRPRTSNALIQGFRDGENLRIHGAVEHRAGEPGGLLCG